MSYANFAPKTMTTLIPKTTSPFCHKWQRVSNSSNHLAITGRASILILIIIIIIVRVTIIVLVLKCLWRRRGRLYKPPRRAYCRAIWPTRVFTWHNSSLSVSRQASMRYSCTMTALRVTPPTDEEGANVEEAKEAGRVTVAVCGHFGRSWASLNLMVATSMAHITAKWGDSG